eukprot:6194514-Prymnesium_polylepis.1
MRAYQPLAERRCRAPPLWRRGCSPGASAARAPATRSIQPSARSGMTRGIRPWSRKNAGSRRRIAASIPSRPSRRVTACPRRSPST